MDNNPNQPQQPSPSGQPSPDAPVFSSSDLTQTKARKDAHYFTNVQKATLWQKISNWFNKVNRESLERSATRKAAFKAKLEERRHAADLAAISAAVPDVSSQAAPTQSATPAEPIATTPQVIPEAPSNVSAPTANVPTPPVPAPTAPASTVIIEDSPQSRHQHKRTIIIIVAILVALIIAIIIALIVIRPWSSQSPDISTTGQLIELKDNEPIGNLDMATSTSYEASIYRSKVLNSTTLDVYADSQLPDSTMRSPYVIADNIDQVLRINQITDPATILLFDIEKARIFIIYKDYEAAWDILGQINEDDLYESQEEAFFTVMQFYYESIDDTERADEYAAKYATLPIDQRGI